MSTPSVWNFAECNPVPEDARHLIPCPLTPPQLKQMLENALTGKVAPQPGDLNLVLAYIMLEFYYTVAVWDVERPPERPNPVGASSTAEVLHATVLRRHWFDFRCMGGRNHPRALCCHAESRKPCAGYRNPRIWVNSAIV